MSGPVVVFTVSGRRLKYLQETLATWREVRGIETATLVFCVEPTGDTWITRECLNFRPAARVLVSQNAKRLGVSGNPWAAMELGFGLAEFVVLAEEDTPVSTDVLEYFEWARGTHWPIGGAGPTDRQVAAICAHQIGKPLGSEMDVLRSRHFSPVVWGTWRRVWESTLLGGDWGGPNGWDTKINEKLRDGGGQVLIPARSRSQHIGKEGGAHCTPAYFPRTVSRSWQAEFGPQAYRELPRVQQREGE
jgi:hypothetical protein